MKVLLLTLLLFVLSHPVFSVTQIYTNEKGRIRLGITRFEHMSPHYLKSKMLHWEPLEVADPSGDRYPVTLYFRSCERSHDPFVDWLQKLPLDKPLAHFILIIPCKNNLDTKDYLNSMQKLWEEYTRLNYVNPLRAHIITHDGKDSLAFQFIESFPEFFTTVTILNSEWQTDHPLRWKGMRIRGYAQKSHPRIAAIQESFVRSQKLGIRSELILLDSASTDLDAQSIKTKEFWSWISHMIWNKH